MLLVLIWMFCVVSCVLIVVVVLLFIVKFIRFECGLVLRLCSCMLGIWFRYLCSCMVKFCMCVVMVLMFSVSVLVIVICRVSCSVIGCFDVLKWFVFLCGLVGYGVDCMFIYGGFSCLRKLCCM